MNTLEEEMLGRRQLGENAFSRYNFYEAESVGPDCAVYRLDIRPESLNPYGMVHGGAMYTMADDASGAAALSDGRYYVTQSGTLHFLQNQSRGIIRAAASVRHRGRTTCLVDVDITNEEGVLLATGEFTYFCVNRAFAEKRPREDAPPPPPGASD